MPPPMRLSRDLLIRGITYKLQERAYGALSKATLRKLEQTSPGSPSRGAAKPAQPISLKPGTRLVREWRGTTHMVLVHAYGLEWRGQRYPWLTFVAREITSAHWSRHWCRGNPREDAPIRKRSGRRRNGRAVVLVP